MDTSLVPGRLKSSRPEGDLGRKTRAILYGVIGLGLVLLTFVLWFTIARPVKVVPRIKPMPVFALEDQYRLPINSSELLGRMVIMNFTYTSCGEACAAQRAGLVALREALLANGLLGSEVIFLTVSIDPTRDTPAALQTYAAQLGADPGAWRFATGSPDELKALIGGELGIYYAQPDAAGLIKHEQNVLLVDSNGLLRARYDGEALSQARMLRDIGMVSEEQASTGAMRQVYEASHIFLCYPPD
jgi:protein SCO1